MLNYIHFASHTNTIILLNPTGSIDILNILLKSITTQHRAPRRHHPAGDSPEHSASDERPYGLSGKGVSLREAGLARRDCQVNRYLLYKLYSITSEQQIKGRGRFGGLEFGPALWVAV